MLKKEVKQALKLIREKRKLYVKEMQEAMSLEGKLVVRKYIDELDNKAKRFSKLLEECDE